MHLAGVLEGAAMRLRPGQGWDEGTTGDVLCEPEERKADTPRKRGRIQFLSG